MFVFKYYLSLLKYFAIFFIPVRDWETRLTIKTSLFSSDLIVSPALVSFHLVSLFNVSHVLGVYEDAFV